jgi:hypothetical protein
VPPVERAIGQPLNISPKIFQGQGKSAKSPNLEKPPLDTLAGFFCSYVLLSQPQPSISAGLWFVRYARSPPAPRGGSPRGGLCESRAPGGGKGGATPFAIPRLRNRSPLSYHIPPIGQGFSMNGTFCAALDKSSCDMVLTK